MARTLEDVEAMSRRDLAAIHASELNAALNPIPGRADDDLSLEEKEAMQIDVANLVTLHRRELNAWTAANQ
ncbi:hypothetical protein [Neorhizobium alkalisoli]|uniref:Uncharacterized protein n=1 Tax=Neorhizobium alkalisoli TaxID=528178 RepID=A0A561QSF6_9HYPH|nr:hypothetical protein [Neorhizobium alkalisoli]TWF53269.1 hypothetical protein FHW37_104546 [Neorhizobium alkalisoli]